MSSSDNLNYLMQKLYVIDKAVGGNKKDEKEKGKGADEFNKIKKSILENIHNAKKKQEARNEKIEKFGPNHETVMLSANIRDTLSEVNKQIGQLNEALRRQRKNPKKYSESDIQNKEKQYQNCVEQLKQLQNYEKGGTALPQDTVITLTEMKAGLVANGGPRNNTYEDRDLTSDEHSAMEGFAKKDREIDSKIENINDGLVLLKGKAENMGDVIDQQGLVLDRLHVEVDKANAQLASSNAKLKKLVARRRPNKFCLDIILILVLLGLIGVIVSLATGKLG